MQDGKPVILYIDDDQDFLDGMRALLEAHDYVMLEALSAESGLRVFKKERPDLILLDLMMEEVDAGASVIKDFKALGSQVPIIMISSVGDDLSLTTDCAELGLAGIFQKPVDPKALLSVLKAKLGQRA